MTIQNGQPVDAVSSNAAWLSRKDDTSTVGKLSLDNIIHIESGAPIDNTQRAINETFDTVGMTGEGDLNRKIYSSTTVVADGDSHKVALGKLDAAVGGPAAAIAAHIAASAGVHGVVGNVVGTTDSQTVITKDIKLSRYYFYSSLKTTAYTATLADFVIIADGSSFIVPITLPDPTTCLDFQLIIKAIDITNLVSIVTNVDGAPYLFTDKNESVQIYSDGTQWRILMSYYPVRNLAMVQGSLTDFATTNILDSAYTDVVTLGQNISKMAIVENGGGYFYLRINGADVGYVGAGEKTTWDFKASSGDVIKIKSINGTVNIGKLVLNFFN